ncbi:MAG: hypothetical protein E5Y73_29105 [Mesorhizobium sp.]|nr:MAG: hypothetical protein E5Y85_22825 [Mesorhizobium sp.]TIL51480.1 MAG: hypothetical protein E5Y83_18220 [Mesorhizobium sp.]TIL85553.1 MAG: hypothetical protein E5Y73_29105 [Mesorhizobium sp.]TIM39462.1 MAG: hypothetical protein E5Y56_26600 [Mesorhizobium sp.]
MASAKGHERGFRGSRGWRPMVIPRVLLQLGRLVRRRRLRRAPIILMYHRVADIAVDPWSLAVHPARFDEQIDALTRSRQVVHLHELFDVNARGKPGKPLAVVTFDDGYHDVYSNARPILQRHDCPMTLFVATGAIGSGREFWWDALSRICLETSELPDQLDITIKGGRHHWLIPKMVDQAGRDKVYREVWSALRTLPYERQNAHIEDIAKWAGVGLDARPEHCIMTPGEVGDISDDLITIGGHTVSHPTLPAHSFATQLREIVDGRSACEQMTGKRVLSFAYPFGDHDALSVSAVREAGFEFACTTRAGYVAPEADVLRLPRLYVGNWSGDEFLRKIEDHLF